MIWECQLQGVWNFRLGGDTPETCAKEINTEKKQTCGEVEIIQARTRRFW